jgi:hypothetical protein
MKPLSIIIGFIPQVVFLILANWLPLSGAAGAGLAVAVVIIAVTAARGGVKILPVAQAVILAAFTLAGFIVGSHSAAAFEPYARAAASLVLSAFILATSVAYPFTAQFARSSVPPQYWKTPRFLGVNRRISATWGLAVLAVGAAHLAAAFVGGGVPVLRILLDWGVPACALYLAYSVTKRVIAQNASQSQPNGTEQPVAPPAR